MFHIYSEDSHYILFLSRIDNYQKGLDILIDAFRIIADKFRDVRLILAGYEYNSASDLIDRLPLGLRDRVQYAGFVSGEERIRLLSRAEVFVLPSRHEAHPISLLEALACGRSVVVSDIPELRYIEENRIGLTFKSGSSQELADKLIHLLEDKDLRRLLGDRGREYASQFHWDDLAKRFEKFLLEVVNEKG